ncbi:MAG: hypothetical protein FWF57_05215 [Defluviitaleaceae bacterium]|nr:hypothetical protein [Defluviitaleaceae bacterium]
MIEEVFRKRFKEKLIIHIVVWIVLLSVVIHTFIEGIWGISIVVTIRDWAMNIEFIAILVYWFIKIAEIIMSWYANIYKTIVDWIISLF